MQHNYHTFRFSDATMTRARYYQPNLSIWLSVDPMSDKYPGLSPYVYCGDNPVKYFDPNGTHIEVVENDNGTYTITGGMLNRNRNIYVVKDGKRTGVILGQTMTDYSFFNEEGNVVKGAIIDLDDNSGQNFIDGFMTRTPDLWTYIFDEEKGGRTGGNYDFKNKNIPNRLSLEQKDQYRNRGMAVTINGERQIASARDIGNFAAGYIAGVNGIPKLLTRMAFDFYQGGIEPKVTKAAENLGYARGKIIYDLLHPQPWK